MNRTVAYGILNGLSEEDLISFKANLHTGAVPFDVWERRMEIVHDLGEAVTSIAGDKGYKIPPNRDLMRNEWDSRITPDGNLQRHLGVSWQELEVSYFEPALSA